MRNNQPITQKEYVLPEGSVIISYTDLKGLITHANEDFIEASGFERDELMGKPHNIVRHPDVPVEAFRDLWDTIQNGRPWEGIVKNRRKNGDHYWVKATATPLPNNSGYMSVRIAPTREEIKSAEILYAAMRKNPNIRLAGGLLYQPGIIGALRRVYARLPLLAKILLPTVLIALLGGLGGTVWLALMLEGAWWPMALGVGLPLLLTLAALATLLHQQTRRLGRIATAAQAICADDYTHSLPYGGEDDVMVLACAVAFMRNRMAEMVFSLRQGLEKLNDSARGLAQSSHNTATGAENQSAAAITISAAVEELSASIRTLETDAGETQNIAVDAGHASRRAAKTVHDAALEIAHIAKAVNHAAAELSELENISQEIGKIVNSIHEIAEQTNLLALNAAIEAARAGERGRGFAVVADEVRNLASRTTKATAEIGNMVERIQARTEQTVGEMKHSASLVDDGVRSAHDAGDQVAALEDKTQRVEQSITHIYELLQQQALATDEIAGNVDGVAHTAEDNLDAARQVANAASEVEYMAQTLTRLAWRK
ncbi:methyl-accepting chemotaxis protein [Thiorhodospira sibirica]|uniref:methyl-accepting chemotaxis protein n=1 Tax=Thiorhodospira sibirica TaxID=154347 RepID=UPI00022C0AFB|nr:PAS domain-containing methyl-accepting chemotaxis protein [Thiorhodospira sibirica]